MTDLLAPSTRPSAAPETCTGTLVLDTSVLIAHPEVLWAFPRAEAVIPLVVIEELDQHKTRRDDVGRAARSVLRSIEDLRLRNGGDIRNAVPLPCGGTVRIETNGLHLDLLAAHGLDPVKADNRILAAALGLAERVPVTVLSNDAALRIKAAQLGLQAAEHDRSSLPVEGDAAAGWLTAEVDPAIVDSLYASPKGVSAETLDPHLEPNQFAVVRAGSQSVLVRRVGGRLVSLVRPLEVWGLRPRSKEQTFALELLADPEVRVIALDGTAGTGKTILALAAGLEQVMERALYDKVSVYRPVVPVGKAELGFLPGTVDEKLHPWMTAVTDALVALTERGSHADARALVEEMTAREKLSLEAVTYLRGRSLQRTFVLIDEAQNLEPNTLKTILTRVGEGTKVVFTGDTSQIDAPYLSARNNAIAVLIGAFSGERCFGHIRLTHCERSEVASLAAQRL